MIFLYNFLFFLTMNMFLLIFHPLMLSILLIVMTLLVIINIFDSNEMMWFSYLLCLVYLGGVLILFVYISSFLPNNKLLSPPIWMLLMTFPVFLLFNNNHMLAFPSIKSNSFLNFNMIFEMSNMFYLAFMLMYLLLTLLVSVYYSSFNKIPLRSFS